jgi:hypothetical protein
VPDADVVIDRPRARTVYRAAFTLFRAHTGVVVGMAALVLLPFAIVDALGLLHVEIHSDARLADILEAILVLLANGIGGLASIFYAGVLDHASAAWHRGEATPAPRAVAAGLPWVRLVLASVLWFVAVVVGFVLAIVPGLVALTLFSLTGPVLVREDLTAVGAMRRSARLVARRPALVVLTAVLPFVVELSLPELAAGIFGHSPATELAAETVATLCFASFVGLLEVVTAHQLIVAEPQA